MSDRPDKTLMRSIVSWALDYRFLVIAAALGIMVFGAVQMKSAQVDVFPEFAPPQVEVQTESLGLSTSDVESLVTVPLEQALAGVPGLDDMRSTSVPQLSSVVLIFKPGTDVLNAQRLVNERVSTVRPSLPAWASSPVVLPPVSATGRALQIGMWSDKLSVMELSRLAYWKLRPRLEQIDGVAGISLWNEQQPTVQLQLDPAKLIAHNVTIDNVERTMSDGLDAGGFTFTTGALHTQLGVVDMPNQRLQLFQMLGVKTAADLAQVPLNDQPAKGPQLRLSDVGSAVTSVSPKIGDAVINGRPGILIVVQKLPWGNTLNITRDVEARLAEMQQGTPDVHFDSTIFRPATFVDDAISNLSQALLLGFVFVVIVIVLFLSEWRVALIALLTIPLSLMAAVLVLMAFGTTINTMILAGLSIALGELVDDAIIDVENILRRFRLARASGSTEPAHSIILNASLEVRSSIVYATIISVVAVTPIFLLQGLTAAFFRPLVTAYGLSIIASMLVALTVTPALTLLLLRGETVSKRRESRLVFKMRDGYVGVLSRIVSRPAAVFAGCAVVILTGALLVPQLGQSLFPQFKQRDFLIHMAAIPSTSDEEIVRTTTAMSKAIMAIPGVRNFGAHIGRARQGEEVAGIDFSEGWISIDPQADYDTTLAKIRAVVNEYPGLYRDVLTYLNERVEEVLAGSTHAITIRIYGENLPQIRATARKVLEEVSAVPGTLEPRVDVSVDTPQIEVEVDVPKASTYGLKPGDVRRQAAAWIAGLDTGAVFQGQEFYRVLVWSAPSARNNVASISDILLDTSNGGRVRLGDIARVELKPNPNAVTRENASRYIDVGTNVQGRGLAAVSNDIEARLKNVSFPQGSSYVVLGEYVERQAAQRALILTGAVALLIILVLLHLAFRSWRLGFFVFLTLPIALVGGVIAIWIAGGEVTLGALVGFFTVFGIAARNSIMLVTHCQHLEREEGLEFGPALVLRGARERLSPILMTSLATGLALLPLVFNGNQPGREIEFPLAVVIIGGLFTSTLLTLFVVPSLYLRFGKGRGTTTSAG